MRLNWHASKMLLKEKNITMAAALAVLRLTHWNGKAWLALATCLLLRALLCADVVLVFLSGQMWLGEGLWQKMN